MRRTLAALAAVVALALALAIPGDAATTLRSTVQVNIKGELGESVGLASSSAPALLQRTLILTNGTAASQADLVWSDRRTIAASTTEDLDLAGGGLTDAFGNALTFARVKVLAVYASGDNTNDVVLGGDTNSLPFLSVKTTTTTIAPGGMAIFVDPSAAGYAVTAGTGDIVQAANGGAGSTVEYDVLIVGASS